MKKVLFLIICLLLAGAVLSGCGSNSTSSDKDNNSTTTSQGGAQGNGQSELSPCQKNLMAIDSACIDYKIRNSGSLPRTVEVLVPNYLDTLPVEPDGGTYTLVEDNSFGRENMKAVCSKGHTL